MKKLLFTLAAFMLFAVSCEKTPIQDLQPAYAVTNETGKSVVAVNDPQSYRHGMETMSMYFEGQMFTVRFRELSGSEAEDAIARPEGIRTIYVSPSLSVPRDFYYWFYPVLNNIDKQTLHAVYYEKRINYNRPTCIPFQFTSEEEILKAVSHPGSYISIEPNGRVVLLTVLTKTNPQGQE